MFLKPSLWANDRGEDSEPVGTGGRLMLAVEHAEPFFSAEPVKARGDGGGSLLVGRTGELLTENFRVVEPSA